ncbi:hypothetical protein LSTR_LSTR016045 [Laodelphax striatellus]|uniref:Adipose-secreted signaling protein n=1 Tax=Laodelphax striatellus TaxID=195883 RepID=A0A482WGV6_LAOST|nr:hypothetical protein LSTR_LSTR016045 [Laodelphax striatellus]
MIRSQASNRSNSMTERPRVSESSRSSAVRFSLTDIRIKDNEITVDQTKADEFMIHLGFLQHEVRYKVTIPIAKDQMPVDDCQSYSYEGSAAPDPPLIAHFNLSHDSDNFYLNFEISAVTETTLSDVIQLRVGKTDRFITFLLTANVLGTGKGTPLLKNGIHVIEVPHHLRECTEYPRSRIVDGAASEDSS